MSLRATVRVRCVVPVVVLVAMVIPAGAAASPTSAQTSNRPAVRSGPPPRITTALRNLARRFSRIEFRKRYQEASEDEIFKLSKKVVKKWVKYEAKKCPDPLPKLYFCSRPKVPHWGRGLAIGIGGRWVPEYRSPWYPYNSPQFLRPGVMFWLTCWSAGTRLNYGTYTSNLWYRLTNGLYVNDGQLSTGTNYALPGVSEC